MLLGDIKESGSFSFEIVTTITEFTAYQLIAIDISADHPPLFLSVTNFRISFFTR
jgi:hypothetical protein